MENIIVLYHCKNVISTIPRTYQKALKEWEPLTTFTVYFWMVTDKKCLHIGRSYNSPSYLLWLPSWWIDPIIMESVEFQPNFRFEYGY